MNLDGKVVLVTGAAHGIGRATAIAFAAKGSRLALADIEVEGLEKTVADIEKGGGRALSLKVDVASEAEASSMIDQTIDEFGTLDVLVNNAGVSVSGPADATPIEDWRWIVDINMWAHVYAMRAALPYFKKRGGGHLVHIASAAGIFGTPGLPAYSMTKFAVYGLAESLAISLRGTGIRVSVVCPMFVDTDIVTRGRLHVEPEVGIDSETWQAFSRELLRAQGIPPEKVADAIVDAVEVGRFLVLPHPEVLGIAQVKWADPESFIGQAAEAAAARRQLFEQTRELDPNTPVFFDPDQK